MVGHLMYGARNPLGLLGIDEHNVQFQLWFRLGPRMYKSHIGGSALFLKQLEAIQGTLTPRQNDQRRRLFSLKVVYPR